MADQSESGSSSELERQQHHRYSRPYYWDNLAERLTRRDELDQALPAKGYYNNESSAALARLAKEFVGGNPWKKLPEYERRMVNLVTRKRANPCWYNTQSFQTGEPRVYTLTQLIREGCQQCFEPMDGRLGYRLIPSYERILAAMIQNTSPMSLLQREIVKDLYIAFGPAGRRLIEMVLERGVDPDCQIEKGSLTPLQLMLSNVERRASDKGMMLNYSGTGSALSDAMAEHHDLFITMLRFGATSSVGASIAPHFTLMQYAVAVGDIPLTRALLQHYHAAPPPEAPVKEKTSWTTKITSSFRKLWYNALALGGPDGMQRLEMFELLDQSERPRDGIYLLDQKTRDDTRIIRERLEAIRENATTEPEPPEQRALRDGAVHHWPQDNPLARQQHKERERQRILALLTVKAKERQFQPRIYNEDIKDEISEIMDEIAFLTSDVGTTREEREIYRMSVAEKLDHLRASLTAFPFYATGITNMKLDANKAALLERKNYVLLSDRNLEPKHHIFAHTRGGAECLIDVLDRANIVFDEDYVRLLRVLVETMDPYVLETWVQVRQERLTGADANIAVGKASTKNVRRAPVFWLLGLPTHSAQVPGPILEVLELALQRGVDPDCRSTGNSTLLENILSLQHSTPAQAQHYIQSAIPVIELLLRYGARCRYAAQGMQRCLEQAILTDNIELVRLILRYGHCSTDYLYTIRPDQFPASLVAKAIQRTRNQVMLPQSKELLRFLLGVTGRLGRFRDSVVVDAMSEVGFYSASESECLFLVDMPELVRSFPDRHPEQPPAPAHQQLKEVDMRLMNTEQLLNHAEQHNLYTLTTLLFDMGVQTTEAQQAHFLVMSGGTIARPMLYRTVKPILDKMPGLMSQIPLIVGREKRWGIFKHFIEFAGRKALRYALVKVPLPDPQLQVHRAHFVEAVKSMISTLEETVGTAAQKQQFRKRFLQNLVIYVQAVADMNVPDQGDWRLDIWDAALNAVVGRSDMGSDFIREYIKQKLDVRLFDRFVETNILTQDWVLAPDAHNNPRSVSILVALVKAGAIKRRPQLVDLVEPLMDHGAILGFNNRFPVPIKISCNAETDGPRAVIDQRPNEPLELFWRQQLALAMQLGVRRFPTESMVELIQELEHPDIPIVYMIELHEADPPPGPGVSTVSVRTTALPDQGGYTARGRVYTRRPVEYLWVNHDLRQVVSLLQKYKINAEPREPGNFSLWDLKDPTNVAVVDALLRLGADILKSQLYLVLGETRRRRRENRRQKLERLQGRVRQLDHQIEAGPGPDGRSIEQYRRDLLQERQQIAVRIEELEEVLNDPANTDIDHYGMMHAYIALWHAREAPDYDAIMKLVRVVRDSESRRNQQEQQEAMRRQQEEEMDQRPKPWDDEEVAALSKGRRPRR